MSSSPRADAAAKAWTLFQDKAFVDPIKRVLPTTIRTLAAVANAAEVPEELYIVLRYQMGRKQLPAEVGAALLSAVQREADDARKAGQDPMQRLRQFLGHTVRLHRSVAE